jgi:hypothetical protein
LGWLVAFTSLPDMPDVESPVLRQETFGKVERQEGKSFLYCFFFEESGGDSPYCVCVCVCII